jgi:hypothetical protein
MEMAPNGASSYQLEEWSHRTYSYKRKFEPPVSVWPVIVTP